VLILYKGSGAGDFSMMEESYTPEQFRQIKYNVKRLLLARGYDQAANYLESISFIIYDAYNNFGDEFSILHAKVPLEVYENLRTRIGNIESKRTFAHMAETITEVGTYIRFIAVDLAMDAPQSSNSIMATERRLRQSEIQKLVYKYIGVNEGYLGDFSYRTHHEFYIELDLDINPYKYDGTTRQRFIKILSESTADVQARILEGILKRYPVNSSELRSQERYDEICGWIGRLRGASPVEPPSLRITSQVVERALSDAEQLLQSTGPISAVDRVHTAIHGYVSFVCEKSGFQKGSDQSLTELFKFLREEHPAFRELGHHKREIIRVLRAISTILDSLNTLRNRASIAHPNERLLEEPEAMLIINSARTILHYIDKKLHLYEENQKSLGPFG
jgi:hypothetical protein